ncbi:hypothetical protein PAEPH01_2890 [Pancytospora epiphaga]|nr:hypothetical protein PAEPH01_2890 [Pancytospora epiphaga]
MTKNKFIEGYWTFSFCFYRADLSYVHAHVLWTGLSSVSSIFEGYALQRILEHDHLNVGLSYLDILQVLPVVLCYLSVPYHHIWYDSRSAPIFLPKLVYNCTCASSLFPPLLVDPNL